MTAGTGTLTGRAAYAALFTVSLAAGIPVAAALPPETAQTDPVSLYGDEILFDVYRKNRNIGVHRTRFTSTGNGVRVETVFDITIPIPIFPDFTYTYTSSGYWEEGLLQNLRVTVNDNGEEVSYRATRQDDSMRIRTPDGDSLADYPLYPTNHWNAHVVSSTEVLNTLTGRINKVAIVPQGQEYVETEQGPVLATRYAYTGQLETLVWYDTEGRWVKLQFAGRDGVVINYVCRRCQGPAAMEQKTS